MQQSSVSHLGHPPAASGAFMWHSTEMASQHSPSSQTIAEKSHMEVKVSTYCAAQVGRLKKLLPPLPSMIYPVK